ncbi:MAG: hypothetical protein WD627_12920 [Actinomycetota bacterium]
MDKPASTEQGAPENRAPRFVRFLLVSVAAIVSLQVAFSLATYRYLGDMQQRGLFGDMFGALNVTFSGLAFAGVIYAIILQAEELGLQRSELHLTRNELRTAANAQATLTKIQQRQEARQTIRNLAAAAARAAVIANARQNGDTEDRVHQLIVEFWGLWGGDVVAAFGAESYLVKQVDGWFLHSLDIGAMPMSHKMLRSIDEVFSDLVKGLHSRVQDAQEELTRVQDFIDVYMDKDGQLTFVKED